MREVLDELGVSPEALVPRHREDLDELGYCRLDGFIDAQAAGAMIGEITRLLEGSRRQGGTLHLKGLLDQGSLFDTLWLRPALLAAVTHLLGPDFQIREMHYRAGKPGHGGQALHMDATDRAGPGQWRVCTAIVALTDFTSTNGATRVVPGSHVDQNFKPPRGHGPHPDEVLLTGPAGTCWLFNSHLWHSGTRNDSTEPRHAVLIAFHRRNSGPTLGFEPLPSHETVLRLGNAAYLLL
ncbi:phytanoyl-CoA dioxygenase family protein [Kibdelosporangium aridum]|uniref:Ectoine hydroxylase-related dioxygenase, phytanoyl-CoA dioxygenase (PhyH) family n=1 Tax=Kibdelosporangium aridum TaxID=2030 RepID=A0A1Y5XGB5_KIBAR|nr:phytanoyl-CoA dioxygenase family protein [Kibdelosporangium aridum]SMC92151.1 Ectoine hydroxylase-related dioxygenase, phytanoyl-CoA dioxygenase (PhyH) family [Kibdelosporangium aridum]